MKFAVLYYSRSGNNRLLAKLLAGRLNADLAEVRPRQKRYFWRMIRDMSRDRRPPLQPLNFAPESYDLVVVLAPVWDMNIAHPMKTALESLADRLPRFALVSFCGYVREGQAEALRLQAEALTGQEPVLVEEFHVGELVSERKRGNVLAVSGKRVKEREMAHFTRHIDALISALLAVSPAEPAN